DHRARRSAGPHPRAQGRHGDDHRVAPRRGHLGAAHGRGPVDGRAAHRHAVAEHVGERHDAARRHRRLRRRLDDGSHREGRLVHVGRRSGHGARRPRAGAVVGHRVHLGRDRPVPRHHRHRADRIVFARVPCMHALPIMVATLCALAIGYRYYSAFIAARVLSLDDTRQTPAHRLADGKDFVPTNRWVLFGHHFAAITGAGPLIGPVLAVQFGFLPGFLWILIGVVIGGAVHDFIILASSVRRNGRSLAEIAREEIGPVAGVIAAIAIFFTVIIAIAAMGFAVVNILAESAWATFTIGMTIPIALVMGGALRGKGGHGSIRNATIVGVVALLFAVWGGRGVAASSFGHYLKLSQTTLIYLICVYGFVASVLPVWLLLVPRDYLSAYMKLGTLAVLVVGIMIVNPELKMDAVTEFVHGHGPIIPGKLFPFVFITIACGAISGFHSLIASGTTPKMIERESDTRFIGYGAMLIEGLVGVTSLIAAASLYKADYFAINVAPAKFAHLGMTPVDLNAMMAAIGEDLRGRTAGSVSLAVGIAKIFSGLPGMK